MEPMNTYDAAMTLPLNRQLESAFAVLEAITAGSRKLQESQLKAVTQAHAAVEAMHKRVAEAGNGPELWRLQSEFMSASLEKSLAYWRELYQTAIATETSIAKLLAAQLPFAMPMVPGAGNGTAGPLADMMNDAYKRWTEAARQFSKVPEEKA
jgi:phasin family protein